MQHAFTISLTHSLTSLFSTAKRARDTTDNGVDSLALKRNRASSFADVSDISQSSPASAASLAPTSSSSSSSGVSIADVAVVVARDDLPEVPPAPVPVEALTAARRLVVIRMAYASLVIVTSITMWRARKAAVAALADGEDDQVDKTLLILNSFDFFNNLLFHSLTPYVLVSNHFHCRIAQTDMTPR